MLPTRYTALSAVGFNADRTFALVGEESDCNRLNDAGDTVLCMRGDITPWEKIGGQWVPSHSADACGWIVWTSLAYGEIGAVTYSANHRVAIVSGHLNGFDE